MSLKCLRGYLQTQNSSKSTLRDFTTRSAKTTSELVFLQWSSSWHWKESSSCSRSLLLSKWLWFKAAAETTLQNWLHRPQRASMPIWGSVICSTASTTSQSTFGASLWQVEIRKMLQTRWDVFSRLDIFQRASHRWRNQEQCIWKSLHLFRCQTDSQRTVPSSQQQGGWKGQSHSETDDQELPAPIQWFNLLRHPGQSCFKLLGFTPLKCILATRKCFKQLWQILFSTGRGSSEELSKMKQTWWIRVPRMMSQLLPVLLRNWQTRASKVFSQLESERLCMKQSRLSFWTRTWNCFRMASTLHASILRTD